MTEPKKSKFPDYFKFDFDLGKVLNYPFQLFLIQAISTPFERLQILKQCDPSIQNFKQSLIKSQTPESAFKPSPSSYPTLISEIIASGKLQIFKGLRINVYRSIFKDYLNARFYLAIYGWISRVSFIKSIENDKNRFLVESVIAAHLSSFMFPFLLTPFDVAKTKAMCEISPSSQAFYSKCLKIITGTAMKEGFPGIFTGAVYGMANSFLHNIILLMTSHFLSKNKEFDLSQFFVLNGFISGLLYPVDTITLFNKS